MDATVRDRLAETITAHLANVQAVYLYGSAADDTMQEQSDVDLAILLAPEVAKATGSLSLSDLRVALEEIAGRPVDLVNLRLCSTVLQKEITTTGLLLYVGDRYAIDEFEMLVLSFYSKLNEERAEILEELAKTGRVRAV
jgi:uncharacterized protein